MELGQRIRQARLEQGLSQKALCGDRISRNMLSLIENGAARPSMDTLEYLAQRLGKPMSFFLEDDPLEPARQCYVRKDYARGLTLLEGQIQPEATLLRCLCALALAEQAMEEGKFPLAQQLLSQAEQASIYDSLILRQRELLRAQITGKALQLPTDDRELLLRARDAMADPQRAGQYLDAAQSRDTPDWNLLRGQVHMAQSRFAEAKQCLLLAESAYPHQTAPLLEACFAALGDFRQAYYYSKKNHE